MSAATHRAALVALIAAVPGVGVVHDYQRYTRSEAEFRQLYVATIAGQPQLRGWHVSRTSVRERSLGLGRNLVQHGWTIRGYMALADAEQSELTFDGLVEAIRAAYRANPTLGGLATGEPLGTDDGIQVADMGPANFAGVLVHAAVLTLQTTEYA